MPQILRPYYIRPIRWRHNPTFLSRAPIVVTQNAIGAITPTGALQLVPIKLLAGSLLPVYYADFFNRVDSDTVGGNWVESVQDWDIVSNTVQPTTTSSSELTNTTAIGKPDYIVIVTCNPNNVASSGILARWVDAANFYLLAIAAGNMVIGKVVAGVSTTLATYVTGRSAGANDTLTFELIGNHLIGYYNNVKQLEVVDNSFTLEGRAGLFSSGQANVAFDSFSVVNSIESTITYQVNKLVSGSNTPAATLAKQANIFKSGGITPSGTLTRNRTVYLLLNGSGRLAEYIRAHVRAMMPCCNFSIRTAIYRPTDINDIHPTATMVTARGILVAGNISTITGALIKQVNKLVAGTLILSGILVRQVNKLVSGTVATITGSLIRQASKLTSGTIATITGLLTRQANKLLSGVITPTGAILYLVNKLLSGAITPTGATFKQANVVFAGALTLVGTLVRTLPRTFSGTIATITGQIVNHANINQGGTIPLVGIDTFQVNKLVVGVLTTSGAAVRQVNKLFAGTLTLSGTLLDLITKTFTGTLILTGSLIRQANKLLSGVIASITSSLLKQANVVFGGTITSSSTLTAIKLAVLNLTGTISSIVGQIVNQASINQGGTLPPVGTNTFQANKLISGSLVESGTNANQANKLFSGTLTLAGVVVSTLSRTFTGSIALGGLIVYQVNKLLAGTLTLAGNLIKKANIFFSGTITSSGTLASALSKLFGGTIPSSGTELRQVNKLVSAVLPAQGVTQDQINKFFSGAITPASILIVTPITGGVTILVITGTIGSNGELITTVMPLLCLTDWTIEDKTEFEDSEYQDSAPARELVPSGFIDTEALKNSDWSL